MINIWFLVAAIWLALSLVCAYKFSPLLRGRNLDNKLDEDDQAFIFMVILFSPLVFSFMVLRQIFYKKWD